MTAEEIRKFERQQLGNPSNAEFVLLKEIAAQLAELNNILRTKRFTPLSGDEGLPDGY